MEGFPDGDFDPNDLVVDDQPIIDNPTSDKIGGEIDIHKIIEDNSQKQEKVFPDGNEFNRFQCNFKKIEIPKINKDLFSPDIIKTFNDKYGIFFCNKTNPITNGKCEPEKEICPDCMKNTQKMYGLKPHYLINSMGRVCTYKKQKMYCLGKLSRIEDDNKETNKIKYSINYVCGHSGQCDSCKSMTKKMEKYFEPNLYNKLKQRDNKLM